jgi:TrpR-related protein YerC/YecD
MSGGKVKYHLISEKERIKYLGDFYDAVSSLKSRQEVKNFFKDLLTTSEIVMLSRRIQIAKMLLAGNTQEEIKEKLKVGFANIANVEKWLNNGFGGYKDVVAKINEMENKRQKEKSKYFDSSLLRRYPQHRWLLNLFK